jgi:hypothetical protein
MIRRSISGTKLICLNAAPSTARSADDDAAIWMSVAQTRHTSFLEDAGAVPLGFWRVSQASITTLQTLLASAQLVIMQLLYQPVRRGQCH